MPRKKTPKIDIVPVLQRIAEVLVTAAESAGVEGLLEGDVLCAGPRPYRRLDCDGRALAYIRVRQRKKAVRIDVTGLWRAGSSRLSVPTASGAASLLVKSEIEAYDAVRFLVATVERTRRYEAKQDAKFEAELALKAQIEAACAAPSPEEDSQAA